MTCVDVQERLGEFVDARLEGAGTSMRPLRDKTDAAERADIERHLTECAECREELTRLEQTVTLLRAVEAPRAPAGFVDRVLATIRPPWYRRLAPALVHPLPVKLPLEAAAVVLVSLGVIYIFHHTRELQEAARLEPGPPLVSSRRPPRTSDPRDLATAADRAPSPPARVDQPADPLMPTTGGRLRRDADSRRTAPPEDHTASARDRAPAAVPPAAPAAPSAETMPMTTGTRSAGAPREPSEPPRPAVSAPSRAAPEQADATPSSPASRSVPETAPVERQRSTLEREAAGGAGESRRLTRPSESAAAKSTGVPIRGRLAVADIGEAERHVGTLASQHGATVTARHVDASGAVVLELAVSGRDYLELARRLPSLGRWTPEREASPPAADVRLEITLER